MHPAGSDLPTASPPGPSWRCAGFIKPATTRIKETTKRPEPLRPISALPPLGRRDPPPRGALLLLHRYYWLIRQTHLALPSVEESSQVATSPCCQRALPDVISENLSCDAWTPIPTVGRLHIPGSSSATAAFPKRSMGRYTVIFRSSDFTADDIFENAVISLCSGLTICSPP